MQAIELVLCEPAKKLISSYLASEARVYHGLIGYSLNRLGFSDTKRVWGIFRFTSNVKFERTVVTDNHFYYKVSIIRRGPFGSYLNNLPYGVRIKELTSKNTCKEISAVLHRRVSIHCDMRGLWFIVHQRDSPGEDDETYKPYLDHPPL